MPKPPRRSKPADAPAPAEFSFRWGIPVLDRMPYTMIYNFLLNHYAKLGITAQEMMFIIHLAQFRHERADSEARPSLRTIAELMGYKDEQQPRNLKKSLIAKGLLRITPQVGDTDVYDVAPFAAAAFALWEAEQAPAQAPTPIVGDTPILEYGGIVKPETPLYQSIGGGIYPSIGEEESVKTHKNGSAPPQALTGWLYMIATDTARELHLAGDVPRRILMAWHYSGLDEAAMADRLYQARTLARKARGDKVGAYWAAVEQG